MNKREEHRKTGRRMMGILCAAAMMFSGALAETITMSGTVAAGKTVTVYAPIGGTVEAVNVEIGEKVTAGQELLNLKTTKVYASQDGVISGVFGEEGEDAETVAARYGAVMYLEGTNLYTASISVSKAYSSVETMTVHPGEKVYVQCRTISARAGTGVITAIDGTNYTVMVTSGAFLPGDSVDIYRDEAHTDKMRIGRGSISRVSPEAVTASGAIVRLNVKDGDPVRKGDVLMETLEGSYDAYMSTGTQVTAGQDAVVQTVNAEAGGAVTKGAALFQLIPMDGLQVETSVYADDLKSIHAGDPVSVELENDESKVYEGRIRFISALPTEGEEEVTYRVLVDFDPDEEAALGMNVIVTTKETTGGDRSSEAKAEADE